MKSIRHAMIMDIIESREIDTQEELASELERRGVRVTQATVSRDIKELRLVKVLSPSGGYHYAVAERQGKGTTDRFNRMFAESVVGVAAAGNLVVVRTLPGSASVAGEAVDSLKWPEILGTLAGDNTLLVVVQAEDQAGLVADRFRAMMRR